MINTTVCINYAIFKDVDLIKASFTFQVINSSSHVNCDSRKKFGAKM